MKSTELEEKVNKLLKLIPSLVDSDFSIQSLNVNIGTAPGLFRPTFKISLVLTEKSKKLERVIGKRE